MQAFFRDLRHAFRGLVRTPGFTVVAVLTLAIGIAATATVYSWTQALFLAPLPGVPDQGTVRIFTGRTRDGSQRSLSVPNFRDLQKAARKGGMPVLVAAHSLTPVHLMEGERPERIWASVVSGNFFDVLGVRAAAGRTFLPEEDGAANGHPVVVLSWDFWQSRFQGDPALVGRTLRLNGHPYTVVGVAPRGFHGADIGLAVDLWVPLAMQPRIVTGGDRLEQRGWGWMNAVARIAPGVTDERAQASLEAVSAQLAKDFPGNNEGVTFVAYRFWNAPGNDDSLRTLIVAGAMALLVLLLACANVANLLLVRALGRRRETAIRLSLGAGRGQLVRLLLAEGLALSLLAGGLAVLITLWSRRLFELLSPPVDVPVGPPPPLDGRVLAFAAAVALLTGLAFSLAPALQLTSRRLAGVLRDEGTAVSGGRKGRLRNGLVVVQVALSCVLLITAGLFARSLRQASALDPGFSARNVLLAAADVFPNGYDEARGRIFYRELRRRLAALPGVESASFAMMLPLSGSSSSSSAEIEGYQPKRDEEVNVGFNFVGPGYFETIGIPVLRGRGLNAADDERAPKVAVINEAMARRYWPDGGALGGKLKTVGKDLTVVGIVKNGAYQQLDEEPQPMLYAPMMQNYVSSMILHVRTAGDPAGLVNALRAEVRALDPSLPLADVRTMGEHLRLATFNQRLLASFLGGLGAIALLLSTIGLYSVIRYAVSQRTRELGVRMALGAQPGEVARLVLGQGMVLALLGAVLGLMVAFATGRLLANQLYGVSATDPVVFAGVLALLAAVSALASWLPARMAARVDPMIAIRAE
jgi:macrolide transport system ATP-binding/permease protein